MLHALEQYPFDVIMTNVNYYDHCNFPFIEEKLLPTAQERGVGIVGMKAAVGGNGVSLCLESAHWRDGSRHE